MPARTQRRHRQGIESRQRILEAALSIAVERGYDGTTMALVTERAELPASSVYWQFKNKDELLAEALDHSYRRWRTEGPTWQAGSYTGTPRERIRTRLSYSLASVQQELEYWRLGLTLALLQRPGGIEAQDRFIAVRGETRRIVREWWASLDLEAAAKDPVLVDSLASMYLAFVDGMFVAHRADPAIPLDEVHDVVAEAMADVREDRVIAIDANPDRGTLAERVTKTTRATVRDVVTRASSIQAFSEFQTLISRDDTRLDVLASDADPMVSEAFDELDYTIVADMAARFYSVVITDCGTGIVHAVMRATLQRADGIVVVSGGSVDEARLASETLTWLESNGYAELVKNAVVALNTSTQGTNLVKLEEIEAHFRSRVREIVRVPYDPALATGSTIHFDELRPLTREAARELAALVVDGLPEHRDA